jgi:serine/threonine protein kinase
MKLSPPPAHFQPGIRLVTDLGRAVAVHSWRGEGSYARVYRGDYNARPCALKLAKREILEAGIRLEGEREVLARVHSPHVVALLDAGRYGDIPFLVLEWLEGETLLDLVKSRRRLPLRQALEILEAVCSGLCDLHSQGVAHGDVRPENVIVVPGRGAVLTDPGAALGTGQPGAGLSNPTGPPGLSVFSGDIRAVGTVLHRMLTGEEPGGEPTRLTAAAGYNRAAVQLWEHTRASQCPDAGALLAQVRHLRRSL